jgi:hypothetical protein
MMQDSSPPPPGSSSRFLRYLPEQERALALRRAGDCGALTISVDFAEKPPTVPLADTVDEQIERALATRGAAGGPRLGDPASRLGNQIHRMRQVGAALLCLSFENLRAQRRGDGALAPADAEALRFWLRATGTRPVELFLDPSDAELSTPPPAPAPAAPTASVAPVVRPAPTAPTAATAPTGATAATDESWRRWMLELYAARGPQSLASFERIFTRSYMPLLRALDEGLEVPKAAQVAEEFRRTFARMYAEACPTFAVTGKRPRLVLDAWDVAGRLARLHGARATHLLLVDGMRWDLGEEIKRTTLTTLDARAQLADEQILWSAVPTTTPRQLATLAHGIEALRGEDDLPVDGEAEPLRGRTAEVVRRIKVGSRDLYKLDLVEARLGQVPLPELATHAAACIARHAATLPPRTLLFVFGDHGFHRGPGGTFSHGGTTPEEVLVPSFALVVGALH